MMPQVEKFAVNPVDCIFLVITVLGLVANIFNVLILTRKEMVLSANLILAAQSALDLPSLLLYSMYFIMKIAFNETQLFSTTFTYFPLAVVYMLIQYSLLYFPPISMWLTVLFAIWRYIAVAYPHKNQIWCRKQHTMIGIMLIYTICPVIYGLTGRSPTIIEYKKINTIRYQVKVIGDVTGVYAFFWILHWILLPAIAYIGLIVITFGLIVKLAKAKKIHKKLTGQGNVNYEIFDRINGMLLGILILYIFTQTPLPLAIVGILLLLKVPYSLYWINPIYVISFCLSMVDSTITFFIYYFRDSQFRTVFRSLFCHKQVDLIKKREQVLHLREIS